MSEKAMKHEGIVIKNTICGLEIVHEVSEKDW